MSVGEENTPGEKSPDRRSFIRRHPILIGITVFLAVLYWFFGAGIVNLPRFHWYTVSAEIDIDGEKVILEGTIECTKTWRDFIPMAHKRGLPYARSANIIAKRLASGAGLIVEPNHVVMLSRVPPCERAYEGSLVGFPEGHVPRVYWLDDAENPTRIERYEADYFRSANQRVKLISFSVRREGFGAFSRSQIDTDYYSSLPSHEIPWLSAEPEPFHGAYVTILQEDLWQKFPALKERAEPLDQLTQHTIEDFQNAANIAIDRLLRPGKFRRSINPQECRAEDKARCAEFNDIYGELEQPIYEVDARFSTVKIPAEPLMRGRISFYREYLFLSEGHLEFSTEVFGDEIEFGFHGNSYFYSPQKRSFLKVHKIDVSQQYFMRTDH